MLTIAYLPAVQVIGLTAADAREDGSILLRSDVPLDGYKRTQSKKNPRWDRVLDGPAANAFRAIVADVEAFTAAIDAGVISLDVPNVQSGPGRPVQSGPSGAEILAAARAAAEASKSKSK